MVAPMVWDDVVLGEKKSPPVTQASGRSLPTRSLPSPPNEVLRESGPMKSPLTLVAWRLHLDLETLAAFAT